MENFVNVMSREGHTQCYYDTTNKAEYEQSRADFMKKIGSGNIMYGKVNGEQQLLLNAYDKANFSKMDQVLADPLITDKTIDVVLTAG